MSATPDHPRFGTPAQRASNARLHTTLPCSLPLLPARASLAAALTACGSVHAPLGRRSALNEARVHAAARLQARPKVRPCPRHASTPPCDPRRALCRSSARPLALTAVTVLVPHSAGSYLRRLWRHTFLLAARTTSSSRRARRYAVRARWPPPRLSRALGARSASLAPASARPRRGPRRCL